MSMIGNYLKVTPHELRRIMKNPSLAEALIYPEDENYPEPPQALDIDKSWHIIHFLLNGDPWEGSPPLSLAVLGGTELPDTDGGYGPIRYLTPEEVGRVSAALDKVSFASLWTNFDSERAKTAEIYPDIWAGSEEDKDYIGTNYKALQDFFTEASTEGLAVLLYLS